MADGLSVPYLRVDLLEHRVDGMDEVDGVDRVDGRGAFMPYPWVDVSEHRVDAMDDAVWR